MEKLAAGPMTTEIALLLLMLIANGSPVVMRAWLGERLEWPLDGGIVLGDGRRLLGSSKTVIGALTAITTSAAFAPWLGLPWFIGALVGLCSMIGDAASSFVKRRRGMEPGAKAIGLDQIPESLLAMLACKPLLDLGWLQVVVLTLLFMVANLAISKVTALAGLDHHPH
jgi:CDP-2,3-bis-(O-geranylgeranyl)-sn-glycerol synthase